MTKYYCDRCGVAVLSPQDLTEIGSRLKMRRGEPRLFGPETNGELCQNCYEALKNWLRPLASAHPQTR